MFERHGFSAYDADIRARIIYFMQLGYHAMEVHEPMAERLNRLEGYLRGFTGVQPVTEGDRNIHCIRFFLKDNVIAKRISR